MALHENLKLLREQNNITQQQLADKLYVSRQTICRWENGSRCPDLIMAKKLAVEFSVSLDELISDDDLHTGNYLYPFKHSNENNKMQKLKVYQNWVLKISEIIGSIFVLSAIFIRIQLKINIPLWFSIMFIILGIIVVGIRLLLSWLINRIGTA